MKPIDAQLNIHTAEQVGGFVRSLRALLLSLLRLLPCGA